MSYEKLPMSIHDQDGCHNCRFVFMRCEHDSAPMFFCTHNAPPRPKCGSVLMSEIDSLDDVSDIFDAWDDWSDGRCVEEFQICDEHEARCDQ